MEHQARFGGRLGSSLVAIGAITRAALEAFLHRLPSQPDDIRSTGIDGPDLMGLLLRLIYTGRLETLPQFAAAIKLPHPIVGDLVQMAVDRKLLHSLGARGSSSLSAISYTLTEEGHRWTVDALQRMGYVGPAPVTLTAFTEQVSLQKLTNEAVPIERIQQALTAYTFDESIIEQCGPALNSGRAMLLYGPPGNGKTSLALALSGVFSDIIYIPYAILVEGQIIRVFDPSIHRPADKASPEDDDPLSIERRDIYDQRWVPCRRPFVVAGGELTLDMLDLRYEPVGRYYEAPLHMKALGGCFIIDDFGRQLVSPTHLLNRWIVPLESRVDYLKLHTGKSFSIPFEELVIFSTNLEPEDLMDPAFLRRLPYKIEIGAPSVAHYHSIFEKECARHGLELPTEVFEAIVQKLQTEKQLELAAYQPRFIVDQVVASCRFRQQEPRLEPRFVRYALDNLRVNRRNGHVA
ncbi:MAG TPA: hypothetical protein VMA34_05970 [Terracidiphilus sp.]|nr:hypothetical protein [Terracidiphilus sp.]